MQRWISLFALSGVIAIGAVSGGSDIDRRASSNAVSPDAGEGRRGARYYDVTVTNLTRGQQFTPILVASHGRNAARLFDLGAAASAEIEALAEFGDTGPLAGQLMAAPHVGDVNTSAGLLDPGQSVTVRVSGGRYDHISLGSMLIPSNDAFVALSGARPPGRRGSASYRAVAYDAGTEINDELCASIPGPDFVECGGPGSGGSPGDGAEGFVHVHAGIHGIGDLDAAQRDWRNPVAAVRITAVNDHTDGDDDDDDDSD